MSSSHAGSIKYVTKSRSDAGAYRLRRLEAKSRRTLSSAHDEMLVRWICARYVVAEAAALTSQRTGYTKRRKCFAFHDASPLLEIPHRLGMPYTRTAIVPEKSIKNT